MALLVLLLVLKNNGDLFEFSRQKLASRVESTSAILTIFGTKIHSLLAVLDLKSIFCLVKHCETV